MADQKKAINIVHEMLKDRVIHPSGRFSSGNTSGRWYADNDDLICVRSPSRAWPFSEMTACRTKKYVSKVAHKFNCRTVKKLLKFV